MKNAWQVQLLKPFIIGFHSFKVDLEMTENAAQEEEVEVERTCPVTSTQRLLIQQQMRQHVQLTTQHFLQTCQHPLYSKYAKQCKVNLVSCVFGIFANRGTIWPNFQFFIFKKIKFLINTCSFINN